MSTGNQLTTEQLKRIEENRQRALEKKAYRLNQTEIRQNQSTSNAIKQAGTVNISRNKQSSSGIRQKTKSIANSSSRFYQTSSKGVNVNSNFQIGKGIPDTCNQSNSSTTRHQAQTFPNSEKTVNDSTRTFIPTAQFSSKSNYGTTSKNSSAKTVQCVLFSRTSFSVDVSFNQKLIDIFKQMPTKNYNAVTKVWTFHLSDYGQFCKAVNSAGMQNDIEPLPKAVLSTFRQQRHGINKPKTVPEVNLNSVDSELVEALIPFQRDGVGYAIERQGRILIADDMGLGKTFQAICIACYYRAEWPLLIVSPSSLRFVWKEMLQKWLPSIDPEKVNVVQKVKECGTSGLVNILSYELLARKAAEIKSKTFQDESHFLKNFKTARTKAAIPILKNANRVILLSGTPALSRPCELYVQINAIDPTLFPVFHEFGLRYCNACQNKWGWDYTGSSNMTELQLLLEEGIMIRRTKKQVLSQLPSKSRQVVILDPALVNTHRRSLQISSKEISKNANDRSALLQYFNGTGLAKIKAIKDYVVDLLECGCKFLVFAHHQTVLDMLCDVLTDKKIKHIRIDGSTNVEKRQENCHTFQSNKECVAAVLSITAANAGLTLTAASLVIFAELFWNPGILMQAEDRVHRIGQKESVTIRYLVAKDTADDYIWPLIQEKLNILGKAGLAKDNFTNAETTNFKDPRQRDILSYFEQVFIEEDPDDDTLKCITEMEDEANSQQESANDDTKCVYLNENKSHKRKASQNVDIYGSVVQAAHGMTDSKQKKLKSS
ncbi:SWI/SNF-related matrix-associated actin-dependent regulator of chromatin subfamily A-like protein 1 isoform X2 [Antedon mediterranea]|uniref:SWI/SNF-related matrix-associated actin-dependent regulator of chromatin subfamily A-like protein 1 isoform X2 n=1 Tax=Antedon mediterranea TaxID=105859 RepID=UPI003AF5C220